MYLPTFQVLHVAYMIFTPREISQITHTLIYIYIYIYNYYCVFQLHMELPINICISNMKMLYQLSTDGVTTRASQCV